MALLYGIIICEINLEKDGKKIVEMSEGVKTCDMKKILTIAGSDSSGGAGIQADLKTIAAHKMYGMSAITSLTAQNTMGVYDILDVSKTFLENELDAIFTDIYPDAIKTGMVSDKRLIEVIAKKLTEYKARNIVIDPVMVATSGARLLKEDAIETLRQRLLPLASLITPNIPETEVLSGMEIGNKEEMERAARKLFDSYGLAVLVKGGHSINDANDFLICKDGEFWLSGERVDNKNTHGTGCTLSSAIACELAAGKDMYSAVKAAKEYLTGALRAGLDLGKGSGPLDHTYWTRIEA